MFRLSISREKERTLLLRYNSYAICSFFIASLVFENWVLESTELSYGMVCLIHQWICSNVRTQIGICPVSNQVTQRLINGGSLLEQGALHTGFGNQGQRASGMQHETPALHVSST